jgi:serine protease AprX
MTSVGGPSSRSPRLVRASLSLATVLGLAVVGGAPVLAAPSKGSGAQPPTATSNLKSTIKSTIKSIAKSNAKSASKALGTHWGDDDTHEGTKATQASGRWNAKNDHGSLYSLTKSIGAQTAWHEGFTGRGVTVAVIDTGIAPVTGLVRSETKVMNGPDLSFESQTPATANLDGFGHGTHLAGIIAGEDARFDPRKPSPSLFAGVAPEAQLLNMKVGVADGGVDVSQVIAALDWVVEHRHDQGMNVRVVNLAYGTESVQPWQVDPLAHAVENAWDHGLVVVTAAGNDGLAAPSLLMPAADPHVLAVGADDHHGTTTTSDDTVADFTSGGSAQRRPDLLAPGKSVVSLRVRGSYVDRTHPEGRVSGDSSGRFFRGSGTSQASAVMSGVVALLLDARPSLTPDQVRSVLTSTAIKLHHESPVMGAGVVDVRAAVAAARARRGLGARPAADLPDSTGTGSLEDARGGEHVLDPMTGDVLTGETDAYGDPWNADAWAAASAAGTAWHDGVWNGQRLSSDTWVGNHVAPYAWSGTSWSGLPWSEHVWSDAQWLARSWRNDGWRARSWREESWSARSWRGLLS